ncbi:hypothetical protein F8E02_12510 [Methanoculleus sp. Wushi-C6]|uniref:Uncharacterized protein n=1 Tax=Methanoculleus caldifontis TaxID=2651577 RepID=A0ABU3X4Q6_9EURY|nr:hypothetical protein [Methanoculleus sp. Wushi-C6]MDV2482795.1 hypothetical protein [Methanoculleus sp. Wushi-C6]
MIAKLNARKVNFEFKYLSIPLCGRAVPAGRGSGGFQAHAVLAVAEREYDAVAGESEREGMSPAGQKRKCCIKTNHHTSSLLCGSSKTVRHTAAVTSFTGVVGS